MEECQHPKTVQILGQVFKCSECGEVYRDTNVSEIDTDKYHRIQANREARRRAYRQGNWRDDIDSVRVVPPPTGDN